jgi:hypothetical protein
MAILSTAPVTMRGMGQQGLNVYAAAGSTHARTAMPNPTADVTYFRLLCHAHSMRITHFYVDPL